jgi:hypothetical protein
MTRPMAELATQSARRGGAAWLLGWLLVACAHGPTLSLGASSSFRAQKGAGLRSHGVWAGAHLGWTAGTRARGAAVAEIEPLQPVLAAGRAAPCAFDLTCRWEREQRLDALADLAGREGALR